MGGSDPSIEKFETLTGPQGDLLKTLIQQYVLPSFEAGGVESYGGRLTPQRNEILQGVYSDVRDEHGRLNVSPEMQIRNDRLRELMGGSPVFNMDPDKRAEFYRGMVSAPTKGASRNINKELAKRYGSGSEGDLAGGRAVSGAALDERLTGKEEELVYRDVGRERLSREKATGRSYTGARLDSASRASDLTNALLIGHAERREEGQFRGEDFYKWQTEQPYYNPWLGFLPQILGTQTFTTGVNPGQPSQAGPILASALSGLTSGYAAGQQLFGQPAQAPPPAG